MELSSKIKRLLSSPDHGDRAIGISLLEKLPDYEQVFHSNYATLLTNSLVIQLGDSPGYLCTMIISQHTYWVNTAAVYMWIGNHPCTWQGSNEVIIKL